MEVDMTVYLPTRVIRSAENPTAIMEVDMHNLLTN